MPSPLAASGPSAGVAVPGSCRGVPCLTSCWRCAGQAAGGGGRPRSAAGVRDAITRNTDDLAARMQLAAFWEGVGEAGDLDAGLCTPAEVRRLVYFSP